MSKENTIKVFGMELPVFLFFFAVIAASAWMNIIPNEMLGAAAILFSLELYWER